MPDRVVSSLIKQIFQVDQLAVRVYPAIGELTQDAADIAENYLQSLLMTQDTVSVILATGNSQLQFLEHFIQAPNLDWKRINFFHLDEYLGISALHPGSFNYYLREKVDKRIQSKTFNYIQGEALQPLAECARYSKLIEQQTIDLCLLGIGDNGHLAFNEPSVADFADTQMIKIVQLETTTRQQQVEGDYFPSLESVPKYAYTLTIPTICKAKKILCLAAGKKKAPVITTMLEDEITPRFPASILRTQPQAILFCDRVTMKNLKIDPSPSESSLTT